MSLIINLEEGKLQKKIELAEPLHLAIGVFDGVHLGHQKVISSAVKLAQQTHSLSGVLTFWPHPANVLKSNKAKPLILSFEERCRRIFQLGVDVVFKQHFSKKFSELSAFEFLDALKKYIPSLSSLHVGVNFHFGHNRSGHFEELKLWGQESGVQIYSVERLFYDGEPISSSRIRNIIRAGCVEDLSPLLGEKYHATSSVIKLDEENVTLSWDAECIFKNGFYLLKIVYGEHFCWGVFNYYGQERSSLKVRLLKPCGNIKVGDEVDVQWVALLREESKEKSSKAHADNMEGDIKLALDFISSQTK